MAAVVLGALDPNILISVAGLVLAAAATVGGIVIQTKAAEARARAEEARAQAGVATEHATRAESTATRAEVKAEGARDKANVAEGHTHATNDEITRLVAAYEGQVRSHLNSIGSLTELLDRATTAIEECERDRNQRGQVIDRLTRRVAALEAALAVARPDLAQRPPDAPPHADGA